jgi:hypothetical protein
MRNCNKIVIASLAGISSVILIVKYRRYLEYLFGVSGNQEIVVITSPEKCVDLIKRIKVHCEKYNVLGFDAEWVTVNGTRNPVALIQLCTSEGLCGLIRLDQMKEIPEELRDILEDNTILKVGVAPLNDANLLLNDYNLQVNSTCDLRFLAEKTGVRPGSLGHLSKSLLKIDLDKDWRIRCSNWEAPDYSDKQIEYAAKDAECGIEIFKFLFKKLGKPATMEEVLSFCDDFLDVDYKNSPRESSSQQQDKSSNPKKSQRLEKFVANPRYGTRTYGYLINPAGELVCPILKRKAEWYVSRKLGEVVQEDPFVVQLNFEPTRKSIGFVDESYLNLKEMKCFVCGKTERIIRKYVVPKEYRKHFPGNFFRNNLNILF